VECEVGYFAALAGRRQAERAWGFSSSTRCLFVEGMYYCKAPEKSDLYECIGSLSCSCSGGILRRQSSDGSRVNLDHGAFFINAMFKTMAAVIQDMTPMHLKPYISCVATLPQRCVVAPPPLLTGAIPKGCTVQVTCSSSGLPSAAFVVPTVLYGN
jgi:hypothetical protein